MRTYAGIAAHALPDPRAADFVPRLRDMLTTLDLWARDASFGFGRIEGGETPSGGGTPIGGVSDHGLLSGLGDDDHAQYLLLAGRSGGQSLGSVATEIPLTIVGGSSTSVDVQRWQDAGASFFGAVQVRGGATPRAAFYSDPGTSISLFAGNPVSSGATYPGIDVYGSGNRIQIVAARLGWGTSGASLLTVDAASISGLVIDSDDNLRIIRRSATQTGMALRLTNETDANTLASIGPGGAAVFTGTVGINGSTSGAITLSAGATPTPHSLTLPGANAAGVLANDGAGALSWLGGSTAPLADLYLSSAIALYYDVVTGNGGTLIVEGGAPTGAYIYDFPPNSGTVVIDGTSDLYTLTLGTASVARCNSSSVGFSIRDNTTTTKAVRFTTSGMTTNHTDVLEFASSGARTIRLPDSTGLVVAAGNAASSASVPLGTSNLTGQTASIGSTTLLTGHSASAGLYRVSVYMKTTTAGSGGDVVRATVGWNDGSAQTMNVPMLTTGGAGTNLDLGTLNAFVQGSIVVYAAASQNITYTTTVTKTGSPQYEIHVRIEQLG